MGKLRKKMRRIKFRNAVLLRDNYTCLKCCETNYNLKDLAVHHITNRSQMPGGGYVKENGITLCPECHLKAEAFHNTGKAIKGYSPEELYVIINSSYEQALKASKDTI